MDTTTIQDADRLLKEVGVSGTKRRAAIIGTCNDILKRIERHFKVMHISPYNPNLKERKGYTPGSLRRSIHWAVQNATGGDDEVIRFYVENVASFVELAVQGDGRDPEGKKRPGWKVRNGGLPKRISDGNYDTGGGIHVGRTNDKGKVLQRKAKPFISGEMRVHARMLFDRLIKNYAFVGNVIVANGILPGKITKSQHINWMVKHQGWEPANIASFNIEK